MLFRWLKKRRRQKLQAQVVSAEWQSWIQPAVRYYSGWPQTLQQKLEGVVQVLVAEKNWEGCAGLQMTGQIQVTIAAQAALMLMGMENYYFDRVQSILVYPRSFVRESQNGLLVGEEHRAGEYWWKGPIVLSWQEVLRSRAGQNLVIHEFSHHVDGIDGAMDGSPLFAEAELRRQWNEVSQVEFAQLTQKARQGRRSVLDPYGAKNRAEFFAVASELFFTDPTSMHRVHGKLYELLSHFYRVDPRQWTADSS